MRNRPKFDIFFFSRKRKKKNKKEVWFIHSTHIYTNTATPLIYSTRIYSENDSKTYSVHKNVRLCHGFYRIHGIANINIDFYISYRRRRICVVYVCDAAFTHIYDPICLKQKRINIILYRYTDIFAYVFDLQPKMFNIQTFANKNIALYIFLAPTCT